ncbi:hypothetical protein [Acaryochloris sp. IP29b_bin.137]|uniref:hypothetical protein n=1 Tax=Acaryochloris sp. IP29b_bin.137 TaxID=2969217 RepID=UPI00263620AE|nr:hypothetical protein [Acaryochloris sp. IP29b_bin.137]
MSQLQNNPKASLTPDSQSELFDDLSDQEQETISAGSGFLTFLYFETQSIFSSASNMTEIDNLTPGSDGGGRTSNHATYDSKRTTFAFGGLIPIGSVASFISSIIKLF